MWIKKHIRLSFEDRAGVSDAYRSLGIDYPKFHKMDGLSRLGFVASEMIFRDDENRFEPNGNTAVICFNRSSSLDIDIKYAKTIEDSKNYYPSPSLFVYTLSSIVTGEIAIRNKFGGETSFHICEKFDARQMVEAVEGAFGDQTTTSALVGWIECVENINEVLMILVEKEGSGTEFTESKLQNLYDS